MNPEHDMRLQVLLPTEILVDETVLKINAEAEDGQFCLLPRHIDFVAALVPSVLFYWNTSGQIRYAAVDEGIMVKCGRDVFVSTPNGVCGTHLEQLEMLVEEQFNELNEHERKTRTALARLEAGTLKGFLELQEKSRD